MATALVTGATSGIGESFTRLLAGKGYDLVIVARDVNRLHARAANLRERYKIQVEVLPADLSVEEQVKNVANRLSDVNRPIEVLINNAGYGIKESFFNSELKAETDLLDVLVRAPMILMHAALPGMKARDIGTIINVSSVAAFIAGGSYSAAKSYLTVLSEALHTESIGTNVNVLSLNPGFTHTEFHQRGRMRMSGLPEFMWLNADEVAKEGWEYAKAGKAICIPGRQYLILSTLARFGPRPIVRKLGIKIRMKQRGKRA